MLCRGCHLAPRQLGPSSRLFLSPYPLRQKTGPSSPSCTATFHIASTRRQPPEAHTARPFDPMLPSVSVHRQDGSISRYNILPTPKANREKLGKALEELLQYDEAAVSADNVNHKRWLLDERGDAIHRHLAFAGDQEARDFRSQLMAAADEMNHHPHITGDTHMTVTCTTHNPRGLSMRDVRLARKVDELAGQNEIDQININYDQPATHHRWREQRQINRQAIDDALAKQEGACFTQDHRAEKR